MALLTKNGSGLSIICSTAAEIADAFVNDAINEVIIPEGTYSFGASPTVLQLNGDRSIKFIGNVIFSNAIIRTKTYVDGDYYSDVTKTCTWNGGTSKFDSDTAGIWGSATTDWEIFVRDAWYTLSAVSANDVTPNETIKGSGLTNKMYALCKPTRNLYVLGDLTITFTSDPAGNRFAQFYGLAECNLSLWNLVYLYPPPVTSFGVLFGLSAHTSFPRVQVIGYEPNGLFDGIVIIAENVFNCTAYGWRVEQAFRDEINDTSLYPIWIQYSENFRLTDCFVSGNSRENHDVAAPIVTHVRLDASADTCVIRGHSIAPYSEHGAENHCADFGGTSDCNTIDVAS